MKYTKSVAVLCGVAVAVATCTGCFTPPVKVYADMGSLAGAVDYITGLSDAEVAALTSTTGGGYVAGAVLGIYLCTKNPLQVGEKYDASALSIFPGNYYAYRDGVSTLKFGTVLLHSGSNVPSGGGFTFAYSEDFELRSTASGSIVMFFDASANGRVTIYSYDSNQNYLPQLWIDVKGFFTNVSVGATFWGGNFAVFTPNIPTQNYGASIPCNQSNWNVRPALIKADQNIALPSGDIDPADPMIYIDNVLRPYVEINYPDYIYLLPEPEPQPTETLDPSETMPGLPVIELPTVPPPEYDLELPEKMLEGAGFWFTALTEVLEEMGWLAVVVALCVIAIVLYYVF